MDAFVETFLRTYGIPALGIDPQSVDERFTAKLLQSVISFGLEESGKKMLVDKITPYEGTSDLVRKQLERYFPAAKKIFLLRDPRDVVLSNVFLWLGRNPNPSSIQSLRDRVFLLKATENYQRFLCNSDLDRFCDQWMDAVRYLMPLCGMTIRYEDLLLDQASQLAAIFQYLSVECSAQTITGCCEASSFYRMTGGRARGDERVTDFFRKGIAGDWRNYLTQGDGAAIDSRIGEMMMKLGYVTDRGWFLNLPGERVVSR
jgi:hypothetical protein